MTVTSIQNPTPEASLGAWIFAEKRRVFDPLTARFTYAAVPPAIVFTLMTAPVEEFRRTART